MFTLAILESSNNWFELDFNILHHDLSLRLQAQSEQLPFLSKILPALRPCRGIVAVVSSPMGLALSYVAVRLGTLFQLT